MLHKIRLKPGLDKQSSDTGAEGKWVNSDYARFRYGFPEKIGGWQQLVADKLVGAGRDQHTWVDLAGNRFAAIGTNKCLYVYYEGTDIPINKHSIKDADVLYGYNEGLLRPLIGPGYFVAEYVSSRGEVGINYYKNT